VPEVIPALNDLRIVALSCLILHETHDEARLVRVREGVREEAVQRNPVIVAPYRDRYLVLDGAHRVRALAELGCRLALVQLIDLPDKAESWGHLLSAPGLEAALRVVEGIEVTEERPDSACLVEVRFHDGRKLYVRAKKAGLLPEVRALRALDAVYPEGPVVRRVDPEGPVVLVEGEALLLYRRFTPGELAQAVEEGEVLPAGITRFVVKERVLNVRYSVDLLADGDPEERDAELREFVKRSWEGNRIRYYAEPVVLFE
jgi:hypothetical protein